MCPFRGLPSCVCREWGLNMSSATKVCVVCEKDCSNQPRVKDSRGRYFHRDCYDAAKRRLEAAKAAAKAGAKAVPEEPAPEPVPLAEVVDDGFSSMDDFATPSENACPSCGGPLAPEAILCTGCGYNRTTGQRIRGDIGAPPPNATSVEGAASKAGRRAASGGGSDQFKQPWVFGVGLLVFFAVFFAVARGSDSAALGFLSLVGLYYVVVSIWVIVVAFQDAALKGVCCFLCEFYRIYFGFFDQDNAYLKWAYGVCWIIGALAYTLLTEALLEFLSEGGY